VYSWEREQIKMIRRVNLRRSILGLGGALALSACASTPSLAPREPESVKKRMQVPPFRDRDIGKPLPEDWEPYVLRRDKALTEYSMVEKAGRPALQALAAQSATGAAAEVEIDLSKTPWLSWSWWLDKHLDGADVSDGDKDDAPLRIVLGFDGNADELTYRDQIFFDQVKLFTGKDLPFASLIYVWDRRLGLNVAVPNFRSGRIQYLNVQSGDEGLGRWVSHRRNVLDDYKRVFGGVAGKLNSVGVLSDTDDLKQTSVAWYGSLSFS
jgi:hypothetical protein